MDVQKIRSKYWTNFGCCDKNSDELGKDVYEFTSDGESYEMTVTYIDGRKKKVNGDVDCTEIDEAVF